MFTLCDGREPTCAGPGRRELLLIGSPALPVDVMRTLLTLLALFPTALPALAAGVPVIPRMLTIETGRVRQGAFVLEGKDSGQQLLVSGTFGEGTTRDLTRRAHYSVAPIGVVTVGATGLVTPLKEGKATITATVNGQSARIGVEVKHLANDVPINFASEVVPIFTKFGCNAGGCHGKASGQNGFKLSLLGFEPQEDHEYLVKEGRGRRLLPAAPEQSLLVTKAVGQVAHGGGKRLEPGSPFHRLLVRWIAQGAPYGQKDDPAVQAIQVLPHERVLSRAASQQLVVIARMSDGSTRDVTRMTQFEANQPDLAAVTDTGMVTTKQVPGRTTILARFQSFVDVFRATVPLGVKVEQLPPARTFIDGLVFKQLVALGLPPSEPCDDSTFIRRVTIDLAGRLPTRKEIDAFLAERGAKKDEQLIDRLLASDDHADYFAGKWSAVLRNRRASPQDNPRPTAAFHAWIREAIRKNRPYDQFVREILTATGEEIKSPPVVWYRELKEPTALMEDAAQLFLGQRIACAKCHHHPFEKWSQQDYYAMTAFFSKVQVKLPPPPPRGKKKPKFGLALLSAPAVAAVSLKSGPASALNPRTGKQVGPTGLGGPCVDVGPDQDPREKLVAWMIARDNPFFARTLVNRYWKHFLGRGLVDPEDDMRETNPASNPELLDALAKSFADSKYDLRQLVRAICTSTVYRLGAVPNAHNASDRQSHSRFLPRRLHAEVLLDAIDTVTGSKTTFKGAPAGLRAVQLPDNLFESYFLSVFGRPDASSACECERSGESSLAQCLHLINSQEILGKVAGPRARELARDKRPHADRLRDLYLLALSRQPSKAETEALLAHIEKKGGQVQAAYEDIIWALINTKEFLFNH